MDEELQRRAVALAMQYPGALEGSLEDSWDELWLRLGEELGWETVAQIDADALRDEIRIAVESERLRRAGWSLEQIGAWESVERSRALVARSRVRPGEAFDLSAWVGPLLKEGARERLKRKPASDVSVRDVSVTDFDDRWRLEGPRDIFAPHAAEQLEATLTALGAPPTCRTLWPLFHGLRLSDWLGDPAVFESGSRLPLRLALEISLEPSWGSSDLILLCLPGRLGYIQTHEDTCWVLHRPLS